MTAHRLAPLWIALVLALACAAIAVGIWRDLGAAAAHPVAAPARWTAP
jgi:hypothetical protein